MDEDTRRDEKSCDLNGFMGFVAYLRSTVDAGGKEAKSGNAGDGGERFAHRQRYVILLKEMRKTIQITGASLLLRPGSGDGRTPVPNGPRTNSRFRLF